MTEKVLLKQARKGQKSLVYEDKQTLSVDISADNSDPWAETETATFIGRIAHRSGTLTDSAPVPAGVDAALNTYLTYLYDNTIVEQGLKITDESRQDWIVGKPDPLRKFGGIYGYQASLQEIDSESTS